MYDTIYKALVEVGLENTYEPQDYLNFFCLGNREAVVRGDERVGACNSNTPQVLSMPVLMCIYACCFYGFPCLNFICCNDVLRIKNKANSFKH